MAIARTNSTNSIPANNTSGTYTTTFSATSPADFLVMGSNSQDVGATFVSSTYNGVSMTQTPAGATSQAGGGGRYLRNTIYYLVAPSTGSNSGVVTMSEATTVFRTNYAAYSGVDQTTPIDDSDKGSTNSGLSVSLSLTASVAGTWLYAVGENESATFDVLTTWVMLYSSANTHGDSNGDLASGSITAEAGYSDGTARIVFNAILMKPAGGGGGGSNILTLMTMGMGQ